VSADAVDELWINTHTSLIIFKYATPSIETSNIRTVGQCVLQKMDDIQFKHAGVQKLHLNMKNL